MYNKYHFTAIKSDERFEGRGANQKTECIKVSTSKVARTYEKLTLSPDLEKMYLYSLFSLHSCSYCLI